jgi:hypothetical protein
MHYTIIKSVDELSPFRNEYDNFIRTHADDEYYYYLYGNIQCLADFILQKALICIILIFQNKKIVGIAPFQIRKRSIVYLKNRLLQFLGSSSHPLGSKYGSIIYGADADRSLIEQTINSAIHSSGMPTWNEIYLDNIKRGNTLPLSEYFNYQSGFVQSCYRTPTEYTENEFLHKYLKRKSRYKLNRTKSNLLKDLQNVEFLRLKDFDKDIINTIGKLHSERQRFKRNNSEYKHYYSLFDNPVERDTFLTLTKWLSNEGMLSIFLLKINGKIASFLYCINSNSISNVLLMAFDMNYQQYSPAKLLALYAFENQHIHGNAVEMDFLEDTNLFKKQLCPSEVKRISVHAVNHASISSRIKWLYIKTLKRLALKLKQIIQK